jgi:hypothetical protein
VDHIGHELIIKPDTGKIVQKKKRLNLIVDRINLIVDRIIVHPGARVHFRMELF